MGCHSSTVAKWADTIRKHARPLCCGHLPRRMTSSGCLNVSAIPLLTLKRPLGLKLQICTDSTIDSQQVWLSHVNRMQIFLQRQGLESRKLNPSMVSEQWQKHNIIIHIELSCIRSTELSVYILYLIQLVTLGS